MPCRLSGQSSWALLIRRPPSAHQLAGNCPIMISRRPCSVAFSTAALKRSIASGPISVVMNASWRARCSASARRFFSSASRAAALSRSCSILLSSAGVMIVMGLAAPAVLLSFALTIAFAPLLFSAPLRTFCTASGSKGNEGARSVLAQPEQSLDLLDSFLDLTILRSLRGNDVAEHLHSFAPDISVSWQKLRNSLQCRLAIDEQHVELLSQSPLELLQRYVLALGMLRADFPDGLEHPFIGSIKCANDMQQAAQQCLA